MKRHLLTPVTLSLAALALAISAPIAVAAPTTPAGPETTSSSSSQDHFKGTFTRPTSKTASVLVRLTGMVPGDKAEVRQYKDGAGTANVVTVTADAKGRAQVTFSAPEGGWQAGELYGFWAEELGDRGAIWKANFNGPTAKPATTTKKPGATTTKPSTTSKKPTATASKPKQSSGGLAKTGV